MHTRGIIRLARAVACWCWFFVLVRPVWSAANDTAPPQFEPCGTSYTEQEIQETTEALAKFRAAHNPTRRQFGPVKPVEFNVVWHVVAANISYEGGWVPDRHIKDQMRVLNEHFQGTGISWKHTETYRILSPHWFEFITTDTDGLRLDMQRLFKQGGATTMNVFTLGLHRDSRNVLGFASPPSNYLRSPLRDGVFLQYKTLPGGQNPLYTGGTLTHEAGHWLGLRHTFEGGCDGQGDGIADTPAEASPAFGCEPGRDTCPNRPGEDPIYNFMDYSDESCRREFTTGQVTMMQTVIEVFRANEDGTRTS